MSTNSASLVLLSMVVLVISLLVSAAVGVIYRCQTEKRGLRQKCSNRTEQQSKTESTHNDQARLIAASPSIASPVEPTKRSYDTFE